MHLLLVGAPGVGKSTLIRRVLKKVDRPVFGFETKKRPPMEKGGAVPSTFTLRAGSGGGQKNAWWADAGVEGFKSSRRPLTGLPRTCKLRSHRGISF